MKTAWKYLFREWTLPSKFNFEACQALLKPYRQWFPSLLDQEDYICYGIRIVSQNSSQQMRVFTYVLRHITTDSEYWSPGMCVVSASLRRLWICSDKAISWNCVCVSELAAVGINTLLWMAKAFLIAAGVLKEMSWCTHSQQLEYLVNTSGYGARIYTREHTCICREHTPFFLLWRCSNSVCISGRFQSMAGRFFIFPLFLFLIKFQWLMFIHASMDRYHSSGLCLTV